jgi:protoporphyrin/coproporphyrin ferrochelatase
VNAPVTGAAPAASLASTAAGGRRGVVLVNVGTPEAPTVAAVREFLREFLGDPGVVDLPAPLRWALLALIILPFRTGRSAHAYRGIWTDRGSPLLVHARAQMAALQARLPEAEVVLAMRYGKPSLAEAVARLERAGVTDVTLVPMYPQDAAATTGSTVKAFHALSPRARVVPAFYSHPGFVQAYARQVREAVARAGAEYVLFSYHGLPTRQLERVCHDGCGGALGAPVPCGPATGAHAGCYRAQCYATTAAIAAAAGLSRWGTSFQSRLKGTTWLSPFTDDTLEHLARRGVKRLAVVCPAFVADCLETLEEIGQRGAEAFQEAGGDHLELVPAVNDAPEFIDALASLVRARWEDVT